MPHPSRHRLAERRRPPLHGRIEGPVARIERRNEPRGDQHRSGFVVTAQRARPSLSPDPDQLSQRVHTVVALQQHLERVEQPHVEQADDLLDEVGVAGHPEIM